ncbi:VOC family protein [Allosphingosinicella vermicomposti]|uniref:VOC family protein n=1 Tax=Allosphingosinicella vermicomposti TaxID=614671 RepID=UPI0018F876E8
MIFVNLPVADLHKSVAFYEALGARKNPNFSDETACGMVFSDAIYVMLLTHDKYRQFTSKRIADARETSQALLCLTVDNREDVDRIGEAALAAGGRHLDGPTDHGFMYERAFEDPDGHGWQMMYFTQDMIARATAEPAA